MVKPNSFIDCVSLFCLNASTSTKEKLRKMKRGGILEIICENKTQADMVIHDCRAMSQKVLEMSQDVRGIYRVLVEKMN